MELVLQKQSNQLAQSGSRPISSSGGGGGGSGAAVEWVTWHKN
jgi:hypothetical protein